MQERKGAYGQAESPNKRVSLSLDRELYDDLLFYAGKTQRTLPHYIRYALRLHLFIVRWLEA